VLIPIGIESLLDYARCVCLFRVDDDDREWVGKAEDIEFGQAIGRNNYEEFVRCSMDFNSMR
jgi:hypothetical protein